MVNNHKELNRFEILIDRSEMKMDLKTSISELGLGCYALSGAYGKIDKDEFRRTIEYARELGINFFDTAETYGEEAEKFLGVVIKPNRGEVVLSTKIGATINSEASPLSYESVRASCQRSLERLQTNQIDIYFVHFDDPNTEVKETIKALEELKSETKIRHYGVSHLPEKRVEEYFKQGDVSFCMMELSAANRKSREGLLPLCRDYDVKAIAFSVTGRGILTGKFADDPNFDHGDIRNLDSLFKKERFRSSMRVLEKLKEIGDKYGKSPVQVGIRWVLEQDGVVSALTGTSSRDHLEENFGATGWRFKNEDFEELESFFEKEDEILDRREKKIVKEIIYEEPSKKVFQGFEDLVYVMEVVGDTGLAEQEKIEPLFRELFALHKKGELDRSKIVETKNKIKQLIEL